MNRGYDREKVNQKFINKQEKKKGGLEYVTKSFQRRTKIPKEWEHLIQQICSSNIHAIGLACGSIELAYRRTLMHAEELRELDKQAKIGDN